MVVHPGGEGSRTAPRWLSIAAAAVAGVLVLWALYGLVTAPGEIGLNGRMLAPAVSGVAILLLSIIVVLRTGRTQLKLARRLETLGKAAQEASRSPHDEAAAIAQLSSRASTLLVAKQLPAAAAAVAELRGRRPRLQTTQLAKPYDAALAAADTLGRRSAAIERRKARYVATRGPGKEPMMAHDLISDARRLAVALDSDGLTGRSRDIEDVIAGGATGSEILMGLRWHAREVIDTDPASAATRRQAEQLLQQIARALDPR